MDSITHLLSGGVAIATGVSLGIPIPMAVGVGVMVGTVAPDFPHIPMSIIRSRQLGKPAVSVAHWTGYAERPEFKFWNSLYKLFHSTLIPVAILAVAIFLVKTGNRIEVEWMTRTGWSITGLCVGWCLHILYDLYSHDGEFAIQVVFPLSTTKWPWSFGNLWAWSLRKNMVCWMVHLITLGILWVFR